MKINRIIFAFFVFLFLFIFLVNKANAACIPAECGSGSIDTCQDNEHCVAKCCVKNNNPTNPTPTPTSGGGGGGGATSRPGRSECPPGTEPVNDPDYAPTYKNCQSTCTYPSTNTGGDCSERSDGKKRVECRRRICAPICNATEPKITGVTINSATSSTIYWTPGINGVDQKLYVGANLTEVTNDCPGTSSPTCVVKKTLSSSNSRYTVTNLQPQTVYYWKVVNRKDSTCSPETTTRSLSSCALSPTTINTAVGEPTQTIVANVNSSTRISSVVFSSSSSSVTLDPTTDTTYPYQTAVIPNSSGTANISAQVFISGVSGSACTATVGATNGSPGTSVAIITTGPWWQVKNGDVTSKGNITSSVPGGDVFDDDGPGGYPGLPVYANTFNYQPGGISSTSWSANTATTESRLFNYSYFENLVPGDVNFTTISTTDTDGTIFLNEGEEKYGYYWYIFDGTSGATNGQNLTISSDVDLGDRKVILFVKDADLTITGDINLTDGEGFFGTFVEGNIKTESTELEGIYEADGSFSTGALTAPLYLRGSVAAYGGVALERDLDDDSNPAELFEYAPDQMLLFPSKLSFRPNKWIEVAP